MSTQHDQAGATPMAQHRPPRPAAKAGQTFEQRVTQIALENYRREQRDMRARSPRAARPIPSLASGPSSRPNGYPCPELERPAGVTAERFVAFALPSRVGNWLHYPDGRREPFPC